MFTLSSLHRWYVDLSYLLVYSSFFISSGAELVDIIMVGFYLACCTSCLFLIKSFIGYFEEAE